MIRSFVPVLNRKPRIRFSVFARSAGAIRSKCLFLGVEFGIDMPPRN